MRESKIQYNPSLTVKENAKKNCVTEAAIRYYIKTNLLDRNFDRKQNIIDDCRKYLRKHPKATKAEFTTKLGHSQSTIRKYWEYITTEKELTLFDKKKQQKRLLRQANNFYATHPSVTQDILRVETFHDKVLEPFCGTGTMAEVIKRNGYDVEAYDIIDRGYGKVCDFRNLDVPEGTFDVISNPPYDEQLNNYINKCIRICKHKVALLLPLNYLSGEKRSSEVFSVNPPKTVYVYSGRIEVGRDGDFSSLLGNKINYAWLIWEKNYKGKTELRWIKNDVQGKVKAIDKEKISIRQQFDGYIKEEQKNTDILKEKPAFYPVPKKTDLYNSEWNQYDAAKYVCVAFRSKDDMWKDMWVPFGNMNNGFPFKIAGVEYPTSEQAYICGVFSNDTPEHRDLQERCNKARSGYEAKRMIRLKNKEQEREDWREFKIDWMLFCVWQKLKQNRVFRDLLLAIPEGATIIEDNSFKAGDVDKYWGCFNPDRREFGKLARKYVKSLNLNSKKGTQATEDKLVWDFCNYGIFEGTNEMGRILTYLKDCLHKNREPEIDYELLNSKRIYLFGNLLSLKEDSLVHLLPNALLGCACGDIIGSRFEFHNTKETDFELFNWRSRYTDDTCLTVCMCEWLLDDPAHKKETLAEKLVYYAKHFKQNCYGHKFKEWVNNPNRQIGQVSSSNGCAMRVSPIGWYAKSIEEAEELAEISASITHNHPDAIKGAKAIVDVIVLVREGNTKEEVKDYISGVFGYNLETSCDELRGNTEWTSECSVCVPNAIRAFLESWDFESAIRLAVSLGGDSDTIAAMTGSMAEAYYGIPGNIRNVVAERIEKNPKFVEIINEFTRQYMLSKPE